jgi:hypothetical protein
MAPSRYGISFSPQATNHKPYAALCNFHSRLLHIALNPIPDVHAIQPFDLLPEYENDTLGHLAGDAALR